MLRRGTSYDLGAECAGEQLPRGDSNRKRSKEVGRPCADDSDLESSASDAELNTEDLHLAQSMPELIAAYTLASDSSGLTLGLSRRYVTAGGQFLIRKYTTLLAVYASSIWAVTEIQTSAKLICCVTFLSEGSRWVQKYGVKERFVHAFEIWLCCRLSVPLPAVWELAARDPERYLTHSCLTHVYLVYVATHELWLQEARGQAAEDGHFRDPGLGRDT
jgi:hypothetical protein